MKNNVIRTVSLMTAFTLLFCSAFVFFACTKKTAVKNDRIAEYVIVRRDDPPSEIKQACTAVWKGIHRISGIEMKIVDESEAGEYDKKIIVGRCSLPEAEETVKNIKIRDEFYGMVGDSFVIIGGNDTLTLDAADRFYESMRYLDEDDVIIGDDISFSYNDDYRLQTFTVNGNDIRNYTVTYGDSKWDRRAAEKIAEAIADACGYSVDVKAAADDGKAALTVISGKNINESGTFSITAESGSIVFSGHGNADTAAAVKSFTDSIAALTEEDPDIIISSHSGETSLSDAVSVMTFNIYEVDHIAEREHGVVETILKYMPDSVGLQETSPDWINRLEQDLRDVYVCFHNSSESDHNAILYRKDLWDLVEGYTEWLSPTPGIEGSKVTGAQTVRGMNTVLLERKTDGLRYYHINSHFQYMDHGEKPRAAEAAAVVAKSNSLGDYPKFFTGDLNSRITENAHSVLYDGGFISSLHIAGKTIKSGPTYCGNFYDTSRAWDSGDTGIDYVYVNAPLWEVQSYKVIREPYDGMYPSDHFPVLAVMIPVK